MQEHCHLEDSVEQHLVSLVFHNTTWKVIKDVFKHARLQSITYYYTLVLKQDMDTKATQGLHLTKEQYLQGKVDWLVKDPVAFNMMCRWWVSLEFWAISDRNRENRRRKQGLHRYIADGYVRKTQRMI
jgi:hypothetical protein